MRHFTKKCCLAIGVAFAFWAINSPLALAGHKARGPSGFNHYLDSVARIQSEGRDEDLVLLRGRLTNYLYEDRYEFTDEAGNSIEVELDNDANWSLVHKNQLIEIFGEVERNMFRIKVEAQDFRALEEPNAAVQKKKPYELQTADTNNYNVAPNAPYNVNRNFGGPNAINVAPQVNPNDANAANNALASNNALAANANNVAKVASNANSDANAVAAAAAANAAAINAAANAAVNAADANAQALASANDAASALANNNASDTANAINALAATNTTENVPATPTGSDITDSVVTAAANVAATAAAAAYNAVNEVSNTQDVNQNAAVAPANVVASVDTKMQNAISDVNDSRRQVEDSANKALEAAKAQMALANAKMESAKSNANSFVANGNVNTTPAVHEVAPLPAKPLMPVNNVIPQPKNDAKQYMQHQLLVPKDAVKPNTNLNDASARMVSPSKVLGISHSEGVNISNQEIQVSILSHPQVNRGLTRANNSKVDDTVYKEIEVIKSQGLDNLDDGSLGGGSVSNKNLEIKSLDANLVNKAPSSYVLPRHLTYETADETRAENHVLFDPVKLDKLNKSIEGYDSLCALPDREQCLELDLETSNDDLMRLMQNVESNATDANKLKSYATIFKSGV